MEKSMRHFYRFFLALLCLIAINMESKAQQKCEACPTLNKGVTLLCIGRVCSTVIKGCSWVSNNNPVSGKPIIVSTPSSTKDLSKCPYKTKEGKEITFSLQKK